MAEDDTQTDAQQVNGPKRKGSFLLTSCLFLGAGVAGASLPFLLPELFDGAKPASASQSEDASIASPRKMTYIPFGEVTVNLDEGRMNRYLRLKIALQVKKSDSEEIQKLLETESLVLKNWLLSHLSDKQLDEIRGKAGQNMLRREVRDYFNTALFPDGYDRIYDILFEEFNVQ